MRSLRILGFSRAVYHFFLKGAQKLPALACRTFLVFFYNVYYIYFSHTKNVAHLKIFAINIADGLLPLGRIPSAFSPTVIPAPASARTGFGRNPGLNRSNKKINRKDYYRYKPLFITLIITAHSWIPPRPSRGAGGMTVAAMFG